MEKHEMDPKIHHYMGIEMNNQVWGLLEKKDRDQQDENRMIAFAKSSLFHWYNSPNFQPVNAQRGEWMISHVYAVLNKSDKALEHALNCQKLTAELELKDFDLAYSLEALARAYAVGNNKEKFKEYIELAKKAGENIKDDEDKKYFLNDLNSEPWNSMK